MNDDIIFLCGMIIFFIIIYEDMIEFMGWYKSKFVQIYDKKTKLHQISLTNPKTELTTEELLQIWKEQKSKTIYFEQL